MYKPTAKYIIRTLNKHRKHALKHAPTDTYKQNIKTNNPRLRTEVTTILTLIEY